MHALIRNTTLLLAALVASTPAPAQEPVEAAIDPSQTHQTIDGFGCCIVTFTTPPDYLTSQFYDHMVYDLGATMVRWPLPTSGGPFPLDADGNVEQWDAFDPATMTQTMAILEQFKKRGITHFFGSIWSPPAWMKTNRDTRHGGHLRPDAREQYAAYFQAVARSAREDYGIELESTSLQNESYFIEPYESCVYTPNQIRELARTVARRFTQHGVDVGLMVPEDMGFHDRWLWMSSASLQDPELQAYTNLRFCCHGSRGEEDWVEMGNAMREAGRELWMTETGPGGDNWRSAMAAGTRIHHALASGDVSAWAFWQFTDLYKNGAPIAPYYAAKHFFRFVRPGMVRVDATAGGEDVLISAYRDPVSGTMSVVLINRGDAAANLSLNVTADAPERFAVYRSSEQEPCVELEPIALTDGGYRLHLPPQSIVSLWSGPPIEIPDLDSQETVDLPGTKPRPDLLHFASRGNNVDEVRRLLAEGWDPNEPNAAGLRPLHRAAWPGHTAVIAPLVDSGADPDLRDPSGEAPLHIASSKGFVDFVRALLDAEADANAANGDGLTPLHFAALRGSAGVTELLLERGADPNAEAEDGSTPLHSVAASVYHRPESLEDGLALEALRLLLEAGADPTHAAADGWTPLHSAAANGHVGYRHDASMPVERVRLLVEAGADVHAKDRAGRTPLHWAAWVGQFSGRSILPGVTKALIEAGAEVDARDDAGRTPLHYAAQEGYPLIVRTLLAAGADPEVEDAKGLTPLAFMGNRNQPEVAALLRGEAVATAAPEEGEGGADGPATAPAMSPEEARRSEALRAAAAAGDLETVASLIAEGANVNASDPNTRQTALHGAVRSASIEVVKALLEAGADPTLQDSDGFTPVDRANQAGEHEMSELMDESSS